MISKKERTRESILDTAYELFARDGFNKITMKDICEALTAEKCHGII